MKARKTCQLCFKEVELDITPAELEEWNTNRTSLPLIQDHFPLLNDSQREIILSGVCGECFDNMWPAVIPHLVGHEEK